MSEKKETRNYKDTVFSSLFYDCDQAIENAKKLYKALTGITVQDVQKCRLDEALFRESSNDVSYIMDGKLICFIEHQSTINPNMPLRCLIYAARTLERDNITGEKLIYSSKLLKVPTPQFFVLYNGLSELEQTELHIQDAFIDQSVEMDMNLKVHVIDINLHKMQDEKLKACEPLYGYSYLVEKVRTCGSIENAVNECVKDGVLVDYLSIYGSEVRNMLYTEYDFEKAKKYIADESEARGEAKGEARGILKTLIGLVKDGILTLSDAAKRADMTVEEFERQSGLKA